MSKDIDGVDFVTDNNTGGYFVMECQNCGEVFNSKHCNGGESIADTGDYGDCYCPHCGQVDPMECDNANLVWNVQQKKINQLNQKCADLLAALTLSLEQMEVDAVFIDGEYSSSRDLDELEQDGDLPNAILVARSAIAKAKGGAA
ncbi:hypothetical protein [Aeromonas caviae]|uniref:hypothetical protein n=1 Tax=Aeromonas caviae TaxID=648 RepID=UPI0024484E17|nr:hypothetical protein [Aeromonas caviae]MDH1634683.1 hypothetical protein [Aeromonas caviae]